MNNVENESSPGILELIAIGALIFLFWRFMARKKPAIIQREPAMTAKEVEEQFIGDPDFNLNDYCQNIVYRPLDTTDLKPADLLGKDWCSRGDRSIVDIDRGYGDEYAAEQARNYIAMKEAEAIMVNNKLCLQFKLTNTSGSRITTKILNTTQDSAPFNTIPSTPVASAATGRANTEFTANWQAVTGATGYYLDVAIDNLFTSFVSGYQNKNVSNVLDDIVTGLTISTTYYYRTRAYNDSGTGANSNTIAGSTLIEYNDWFLPSKDGLLAMYDELHLYGLGGFFTGQSYWTSSENNLLWSIGIYFLDRTIYNGLSKGSLLYVRACRAFTSTTNYNLRDIGPAGGYIFWKSGNDYLEAAPSDQSSSHAWSNIINVAIGTTGTAIGTGQANTLAIIGQAGHIDSAAKLCADLVIYY